MPHPDKPAMPPVTARPGFMAEMPPHPAGRRPPACQPACRHDRAPVRHRPPNDGPHPRVPPAQQKGKPSPCGHPAQWTCRPASGLAPFPRPGPRQPGATPEPAMLRQRPLTQAAYAAIMRS